MIVSQELGVTVWGVRVFVAGFAAALGSCGDGLVEVMNSLVMRRLGLPLATHTASKDERYVRSSNWIDLGSSFAQREGRKTEDVTRCILHVHIF